MTNHEPTMATLEANGVTLGVEHFGDAAAPLVLLAGATAMLSWPDARCTALGRRDPFFAVANGDALAREIPGARLLVLEEAATAIPDVTAGEVAAAMLALDSKIARWKATG